MKTGKRLVYGLVIGISMCICLAGLLAQASDSQAAPYSVLHNFGGTDDGFQPYYGGPAHYGSTLYGMTRGGGGSDWRNNGVLYQINTDGSGYQILHHFMGSWGSPPDGNSPQSGLTLSGSTLYGCTTSGGVNTGGTVFKINTDGGGYQILTSFSNSGECFPYGPPVVSGSTLYGLLSGSANGDLHGGIYAMGLDGGDYRLTHDFAGKPTDGANPYGSLILVGSTLYGMTYNGGQYGNDGDGYGVIFSINTDGNNYQVRHHFAGYPTDGSHPNGSLTLVGSRLCGMAHEGGSGGGGVIFSMNLEGGDYRVILNFGLNTTGGAVGPYGSLTLWGGKLYGTTSGGGPGGVSGTVFRVNPDGSGYENLHGFIASTGSPSFGDVTFAGSRLFGWTYGGGSFGDGVFFSLQTPQANAGTMELLLLE
jgi:uncharacterized repeat protein (TIGR03803 family)